MAEISTCLWFDGRAEEAARFYVSLVPGSAMGRITRTPAENPSTAVGDVLVVEFTLGGVPYWILNGGPGHPQTDATSIGIATDDQAETDRLWAALTEGGRAIACGWLQDRYGVHWQIYPQRMMDFLASDDRAAAARAMQAMMGMVKLDLPALERAFAGDGA